MTMTSPAPVPSQESWSLWFEFLLYPRKLDSDDSFGAVVFVGYHAADGEANAVLAHTFTGRMAVKLNGVTVPEAGFNTAIAGDFAVSVVFLSGDQTICAEAKRLLGPVEAAAVKQANGFSAATMMHPEESQHLIRAGVKRGVERRGELKPYRLPHPVKLEIEFQDTVNAELASYLPGVDRPRGNTVVFSARDMVEASSFSTSYPTSTPSRLSKESDKKDCETENWL